MLNRLNLPSDEKRFRYVVQVNHRSDIASEPIFAELKKSFVFSIAKSMDVYHEIEIEAKPSELRYFMSLFPEKFIVGWRQVE